MRIYEEGLSDEANPTSLKFSKSSKTVGLALADQMCLGDLIK